MVRSGNSAFAVARQRRAGLVTTPQFVKRSRNGPKNPFAGQQGRDIRAPAEPPAMIGGGMAQNDQFVAGDRCQRVLPYLGRF